DFGQVTEEMFTNMLLRLTGPVTIGLVATEPIARAGPAHLELMILYGTLGRPHLSDRARPSVPVSWQVSARRQQVSDLAEQALLGRYLGRSGLLGLGSASLHLVERLDDQEDDEGHEQEVDDRVEEGAVLDHRRSRCPGLRDGCVLVAVGQYDAQVREVDPAQQEADHGHDDLIHERRRDGAEGRGHDDRDRQVQNVTSVDELPELLEHGGPLPTNLTSGAWPDSSHQRAAPARGHSGNPDDTVTATLLVSTRGKDPGGR